jgi:hypothetical protein
MVEQVKTRATTVHAIMRSASFQQGVAEVRAGRRPSFDCDDWDYERGRQWAVAAPRAMPLMIGRRLNPKAVRVFEKARIR